MENDSVNRNDLLGISKVLPVDKLLDMVSDFFGSVSKPYRERWDIKTEEIRIKKLSEAVKNAAAEGIKLEYSGSGLLLVAEHNGLNAPLTSELEELVNKTAKRLILQELRRELNIGSVINHAGNILSLETESSEESVDQDWITNFFKIVEDVSNEEMRALWGQLLAGEVKSPRSYSRRTLETLKLITSDDAKLFMEVAGFAIRDFGSRVAFIEKLSQAPFLPHSKLVHLREIGLMSDSDSLRLDIIIPSQGCAKFYNGMNTIEIANETTEEIKADIGVYLFTRVGEELLRLVEPLSTPQYTARFVDQLTKTGLKASCSTKLKMDPDGTLVVDGPPKY